MSKHLGPKETVSLLETLKSAVTDFAAREETLNRGSALELARVRQRFDKETEEADGALAADLSEAKSFFDAEKERLEIRRRNVKARIAAAGKAASAQRLKEAEALESRGKFEVQRDLLQTDRTRDSSLKGLEAGHETFLTELALERERLEGMEDRARRSFGGYKRSRALLAGTDGQETVDSARGQNALLEDVRANLTDAEDRLARFRRSLLPLFFRYIRLWLLLPLALAVNALLLAGAPRFGIEPIPPRSVAIGLGGSLAAIFILYFAGRHFSMPAAAAIASALRRARLFHDACEQEAAAHREREIERIKTEASGRIEALDRYWSETESAAAALRRKWAAKLEAQNARLLAKNEQRLLKERDDLLKASEGRAAELQRATEIRRAAFGEARAMEERRLAAIRDEAWEALGAGWRAAVHPLWEKITAAQASAAEVFSDWHPGLAGSWSPPRTFAHAAKFGRLAVDLPSLAGAVPRDARLAFPGPLQFDLPLLLRIPDQGSIVFETRNAGRDEAVRALNNMILRLLATTPPGKLSFTIIDPVELGQNFAGLMHLSDYEARLINDRIWTQPAQIEERLADLNEHIEKVTQMYLRNEFETIAEYNEQAGRIAEKYHFLVIADFPANFSEVAARRLLSIAASGGRCGVYTLIHWDRQRMLPHEFLAEQLQAGSIRLHGKTAGFLLEGQPAEGVELELDAPPNPDLATALLHKIGRASVDSSRVEMPFSEIAPAENQIWSLDTTDELRVPIGRTGATKLQYLALGKGTRQHALVAGKTGSGKSTLFHVIITNLALWCRPEDVEFYLVDFKKGVEFKRYASSRLPHARVVAIESDREFGLSVLQRIDDELKRRGDLFRKAGAQDMAGYKRAGGGETLPRTLLVVDEFQEFFIEEDRTSQGAALLLDRIVRQGRAFGIHVILGSQTLGGAYTLARTTLGQMVVRVALQCNEADAYLIMDDDNPAPRLLSRPGEAIYNDAAGSITGNSPFQVVWLPDEEREAHLDRIRLLADRGPGHYPGPIVFEGNAPADAGENIPLRELLEAEAIQPRPAPRIWLGAPNSIKGPTEAVFHRQSGNNLLIVGQRDEAILAMIGLALVALAAQHPPGGARLFLFDCSPPGTPERVFLDRILQAIPNQAVLVGNAGIEGVMAELRGELDQRAGSEQTAAPPVYLLIHGLQRFKKLRYEEEFEFSLDDSKPAPPGNQLNAIIAEGAGVGIHVICACDTANNLARCLSRKAVSEFEMRVLFQMSANDSATLIDNPHAADLGLHRAIFSNGHEGYLETFRPYAPPDEAWLGKAQENLARLLGT